MISKPSARDTAFKNFEDLSKVMHKDNDQLRFTATVESTAKIIYLSASEKSKAKGIGRLKSALDMPMHKAQNRVANQTLLKIVSNFADQYPKLAYGHKDINAAANRIIDMLETKASSNKSIMISELRADFEILFRATPESEAAQVDLRPQPDAPAMANPPAPIDEPPPRLVAAMKIAPAPAEAPPVLPDALALAIAPPPAEEPPSLALPLPMDQAKPPPLAPAEAAQPATRKLVMPRTYDNFSSIHHFLQSLDDQSTLIGGKMRQLGGIEDGKNNFALLYLKAETRGRFSTLLHALPSVRRSHNLAAHIALKNVVRSVEADPLLMANPSALTAATELKALLQTRHASLSLKVQDIRQQIAALVNAANEVNAQPATTQKLFNEIYPAGRDNDSAVTSAGRWLNTHIPGPNGGLSEQDVKDLNAVQKSMVDKLARPAALAVPVGMKLQTLDKPSFKALASAFGHGLSVMRQAQGGVAGSGLAADDNALGDVLRMPQDSFSKFEMPLDQLRKAIAAGNLGLAIKSAEEIAQVGTERMAKISESARLLTDPAFIAQQPPALRDTLMLFGQYMLQLHSAMADPRGIFQSVIALSKKPIEDLQVVFA